MFGVSRCSCGSVITRDDLVCIGCKRVLKNVVRAPLKCDLCGEPQGTTPTCERCHPELVEHDPDTIIPPPSRPPLRDEDLPFWRIRPVLIGSLCCALSVLGGYFWGRSDQRTRDDAIFSAARRNLQQQADHEREALEKKLAEATAPKVEESFVGGLRIMWGEEPEHSNIGATNNLRFVADSKDAGPGYREQQYVGPFGRTRKADIAARYCQGRLSAVVVSLPASDEPVYRAWRDLLETSRITYGEPTAIVRPPSAQAFEDAFVAALENPDAGPRKAGDADAQFVKVQDEVRSGKNPLSAEWDLPQRVTVRLSGALRSSGPKDEVAVLQWSFLKTDMETSCAAPEALAHDQ